MQPLVQLASLLTQAYMFLHSRPLSPHWSSSAWLVLQKLNDNNKLSYLNEGPISPFHHTHKKMATLNILRDQRPAMQNRSCAPN